MGQPAIDHHEEAQGAFDAIIGRSDAMHRILCLAERLAAVDTTLLICGETGTGKGMLARAIHRRSARGGGPFVTINCGAIPETLMESELFGHVRGAFTGAVTSKTGKFEQAAGGTIFLDEIGDMSLDLQVKLLRVLEDGEFEPVGGHRTLKTDVRVIAATHRDLDTAMAEGRFREDLYYRICVVPVTLPPLREREGDVGLLLEHFLDHFQRRAGTGPLTVSPEAMALIRRHDWPGNIRELRNLAERLAVLKGRGLITPEDLPVRMTGARPLTAVPVYLSQDGLCLNTAVSQFEKALILKSLERTNGVKNQAARLLQINRTTLVEKIKRHGI